MTTYYNREKSGKVPSFKHRTPNWHLHLALGEKRAARYKHMIGYSARTSTNIETLADLCCAPLVATYPTLSQARLHFRLMSLYQQRLRLYCMKAGLKTGELHTVRIYSLYSAGRPANAKPARTRRRFVAGRTLIWHLHACFSKREVAKIKAAWITTQVEVTAETGASSTTWAKFCSKYNRSLSTFALETMTQKQQLRWDIYVFHNKLLSL